MLDVLRDQLNRRQPMDNVSRNLLRLLTATCGYKEVRLMAVQRLEMWLQNPKVRGATQPLYTTHPPSTIIHGSWELLLFSRFQFLAYFRCLYALLFHKIVLV